MSTTTTNPRRKRTMDPLLRETIYNIQDAWGCTWFEAMKEAKAKLPEVRHARAEREAELKRQEDMIAAWAHPAGTPAWVRRDNGEEQATRTRSKPWMVGGHASILLEGITGGFLLERVRLREAT